MDDNFTELFEKVIKVIDKEDNNEIAIVVLITDEGLNIHLLDAEEANKRIDEAASNLII